MTIYTAFIPDQYCVYHTTYSGSLMPANYIGSTSTDNVLINNYHGSVASERYKLIWLSEIQLHPELFSTVIVSYHDTRSNATWKELQVQRTLNVVKSDLFINRAYASVNGFGDTTYTPEEKAASSKKMSVAQKGKKRSKKFGDDCSVRITQKNNERSETRTHQWNKENRTLKHSENLSKSKLGNQNAKGHHHTSESKLGCAKGGRAQKGISKSKGQVQYLKTRIAITDGLVDRYIRETDKIPEGWVEGRAFLFSVIETKKSYLKRFIYLFPDLFPLCK